MNRIVRVFSWLIIVPVIVGCLALFFTFVATTVGLTPAEQTMLQMTSNQINMIYLDSLPLLAAFQALQNVTSQLLELRDSFNTLSQEHDLNNQSTVALKARSGQQELDLIAYNSSIPGQMNIIQIKIDNVTLPTLNLTLNDNTTSIGNGTVSLVNPNNPLENVALEYVVKSQLETLYIEIGPAGSSFSYNTLGAMNWLTLTDWNPSIFPTISPVGLYTSGQMLDLQQGKISSVPNVGSRSYLLSGDEIRLDFTSAVGSTQTITLAETLEFNVGFL